MAGASGAKLTVRFLRRPVVHALEFNQIKNKINAAVGYQIGNRMDIGFRPRAGAADADTASTLSKLAMQIADNNSFHSKETQVFADGMIQQRGYFDIRMSYEDTILGEVRVDIWTRWT